MAVPAYTHDLQTFDLAEALGGWTEFTTFGAASTPAADTDDIIQGLGHVSQAFKVTLGSIACSAPSVVLPTDGVFLIWHKFDAGGLLETYERAGIRVGIGSGLAAFKMFNVGGRDVPPNPYGGWYNYAVDPTTTPDSTAGSPTGVYSAVGVIVNLTATGPGKGNPNKADAIRYGRAEARFNGGSLADGYATFAGFATVNDTPTNRLGLITAIAGGYRWKGRMAIGSGTACEFVDANTSILVDDTRKVSAGFNKIDVRNSSSYLAWTNVNFTAVGTVSRGRFEMFDNPPVALTSCVFTDMDTFAFQGNATLDNVTFRRCGQITQRGALFDGCLITACRSHMMVDDPDNLQNTTFESPGTGYAIEITSAGEYTFTGNAFTGYGADGTANAAIFNNCGSHVTLNLTGGGATPTYRNGTSATTSLMLSITLKFVVADEAGTPINSCFAYIDNNDQAPYIMNDYTNVSGIAQVGYSGSAVTGARWRVRKYGYKPFKQLVDIGGSDITLPVTLVADPQQT